MRLHASLQGGCFDVTNAIEYVCVDNIHVDNYLQRFSTVQTMSNASSSFTRMQEKLRAALHFRQLIDHQRARAWVNTHTTINNCTESYTELAHFAHQAQQIRFFLALMVGEDIHFCRVLQASLTVQSQHIHLISRRQQEGDEQLLEVVRFNTHFHITNCNSQTHYNKRHWIVRIVRALAVVVAAMIWRRYANV
jgi:hypothetical protein